MRAKAASAAVSAEGLSARVEHDAKGRAHLGTRVFEALLVVAARWRSRLRANRQRKQTFVSRGQLTRSSFRSRTDLPFTMPRTVVSFRSVDAQPFNSFLLAAADAAANAGQDERPAFKIAAHARGDFHADQGLGAEGPRGHRLSLLLGCLSLAAWERSSLPRWPSGRWSRRCECFSFASPSCPSCCSRS